MNTYVIRCDTPVGQAVSAEVVAATEVDAREDFQRRYAGYKLRSVHVKPRKVDKP